MATLTVHSPQLASDSSSNSEVKPRPLSSHGMPRNPRNLTVERPHRFSDIGIASPALHSQQLPAPWSPGPFSPPLSARSFGTFIDSEPSTPGYSPRPNFGGWDGSTLVLLKPLSSPYRPNFHHDDPTWDISDIKSRTISPRSPPVTVNEGPTPKMLSPLSIRSTRSSRAHHAHKDIKIVELSEKLNELQVEQEVKEEKEGEGEGEEEQNANSNSVPLGKLAAKMKTMLSRKTSGEKKKSKKNKEYFEVEHLSDKHWTEM